MDEADYGNERAEQFLQARLEEMQYQLNQMGNEPEDPVCRNCREPLPGGQHYCSKECRDDFAIRLAAERRNGKYRGG